MSDSPFSLDECLNSLIELFSKHRSQSLPLFLTGFLPKTAAASNRTADSQQPQAVEFLAALQKSGCRLTQAQRELLLQAIHTVEKSLPETDKHEKLRQATGLQYPETDQRQALVLQLHHRLLGLLYGALTAVYLTDQRSPESANTLPTDRQKLLTALNDCGQHFDKTWQFPLEDALAVSSRKADGDGSTIADVDSLLSAAAAVHSDWTRHLTTWNTVRRLLRFLMVEAQTNNSPDEQQTLPVLWVRRCDASHDDLHSVGVVRGIRISSETTSLGWYMDPVSFGVTLTDQALQQSVEIAGRLSWPGLRDRQIAVQISPGLLSTGESSGSRNLLLSGDSAGGLLGCGMYGLSRGERLDTRLTASLSLKLQDGTELSPSRNSLTVADIACHGVGGGFHKLCAANTAQLSGVALHPKNGGDAQQFRQQYPGAACVPELLDSFAALYQYLTRGYRINHAMQQCSQRYTASWAAARRPPASSAAAREGTAIGGESHCLDVFVKPRISIRQQQAEEKSAEREHWQPLPAGVQTLINRWILPENRWLIITEDAGGGKTVLTWYLAAALARLSPAFFIVRYEGHFPDDLRADLQQRIASDSSLLSLLQTDRCTPHQILDDLLQQRRVIVIYDALDQDNSHAAAQRILYLRRNAPDQTLRSGLRLIVTSRPYAVNQNHTAVFALDDWLHCRLELFDDDQQQAYERQVARVAEAAGFASRETVSEQYGQLIPNRETVAELLAYPVVQSLLRKLVLNNLEAADHPTHRKIRQIRNTGDLYWQVGHGLLERAFKSNRHTQNSEDPASLFQILACYGYLMMLWFRDSRVPQAEIPKIHAEVRQRVKFDNEKWKRFDEILRDTCLTEHLLLKENHDRELSFPSLKMTEFFAAVWLACHCDESVQKELQPWSGNQQWDNVWKLVAEMPETTTGEGNSVCQPASLEHALHALFSVPAAGQTRPTEMMFRAWQVLTRNSSLATVRHSVLHRWRAQFRSFLVDGVVEGQPTERARSAAQVLHRDDLQSLVEQALDEQLHLRNSQLDALQKDGNCNRAKNPKLEVLKKEQNVIMELNTEHWCQLIAPAEPAYCLCSDQLNGGDVGYLSFWMGASPQDGNAKNFEKPWSQVRIAAFHMAATCVTVAQYRLFDNQREHQHQNFKKYASKPDCPMIYVNFHDGICFALWLGDAYCLPSEVEWEGAAWGGINREQHQNYVIGVPPFTAAFDSLHVNFDGNYPIAGQKSLYRQHTVSVRHAEFQPNGFGLWQMSGNVWEYCRSEWHYSLGDVKLAADDSLAAGSAELPRCVRGGSRAFFATYTRCSDRTWYDDRRDNVGFRLSRTK